MSYMQITNTWQIAAMLNIMKSVNSKYNCTKNKQSTILAMWRHFAVSLEIKKTFALQATLIVDSNMYKKTKHWSYSTPWNNCN